MLVIRQDKVNNQTNQIKKSKNTQQTQPPPPPKGMLSPFYRDTGRAYC